MFEQDIAAGKFLEHATVHTNLYGTSVRAVQDVAAAGKCCILDIDVQGARQVRKQSKQIRAIFVFIQPPNLEELEKRLRGRGTETEEQIQTRLTTTKGEMARHAPMFLSPALSSTSCALKQQCAAV